MDVKIKSPVAVPCDFAFAWALRPGALKRLLPPWVKTDFLFDPPTPCNKTQVGLKVYVGPFFFKWILRHENFKLNQEFSDKQIKGPFKRYLHIHRFTPINSQSCILSDEIEFDSIFLENLINKRFIRLLKWRQKIMKEDLEFIYKYSSVPLKILVSGANGFIGSQLTHFLRLAGHDVMRLVRHKQEVSSDTVYWDPIEGQFSKQEFEGFDAVFHLAGAPIAHRWTKKYRNKLFNSRCRDTWLLSQVLSRLYSPPKTVISASAIGFYGDCKESVTELSPTGGGFLSSLCQQWEMALETIEERGCRVVHARFGVVLGVKGGMLRQILPLYHLGLGGKIGSGNQYLSWIGIDDAMSALYHLLMTESLTKAVNLVAPNPVKQKEFSSILAAKLHRPRFFHLPSALISLVFGDMGKEMLLASTRAYPQKLLESGYSFRYPHLQEALNWIM
ncbi:MAG: TIGR01777 family oxidoreductase [Candidatus Rhabdochlamydia oedothoracis]|nr:TIGR01777 family oxidoreductase [Candidatus Rhabdochlamydia oedothoracis]